jgi:hypothetical protein
MLKKRFVAPNIEHDAYRKWLLVRYKGNMSDYVHEFMQQYQLLPDFSVVGINEMAIVRQFLTGLEWSRDTKFICFTIRAGIKATTIKNIQDAIDVAVDAESNAGGSLATLTQSLSHSTGANRHSSSGTSSSNNWRRHDSSSNRFGSNHGQHSFRTPVKPRVHKMETMIDADHDEYDPLTADVQARANESGSDDDCSDEPTFHPDDGESGSDQSGGASAGDPFAGLSSDIVLNVMRFTKKHADMHMLSADELDRRRRMNLCFNCGGADHRARDCKKPKPNGAGSGGHNNNNKPQKKHF